MDGLDLQTATITEVSQLIKDRRLSPVELVQATLDRIERLNPILKAFITVTGDNALERARQAESEIGSGNYRGPLHGIPYTLKDVIATRGVRTTYGHPRLHDFKPKEDATVRTLLEEAGAILVGKVYSQIGRGSTLIDCYNPWDTKRSPGTSSSGSGSAVAASLGLLSMGTDTGGSVRHPASNCNLVGLRATFGRISRRGVLAPSWTHDQAGPLTKTVEDNALASQVLAVFDPKDPISIDEPRSDYLSSLRDGIKGVRVGVPVDRWIWERETEEVESLVRQAIGVLEELGAEVHQVAMPLAAETRATHFKISLPESYVYWTEHFSKEDLEGWPEIRPSLEEGKDQPFSEYLHGLHKAATIRQELDGVLREVDVIAMPTGSTLNDRCDATMAVIRGKEVPARSRAVYLNGLASLAGTPALSVPCGFAVDNRLPVGFQLMGRKLEEALLFRAAYAYEQATEWHLKHPFI
ncbi:MAG: amidase [Chloroflexi bacterium]|nr:amidase [Chloroflexota bacterium]